MRHAKGKVKKKLKATIATNLSDVLSSICSVGLNAVRLQTENYEYMCSFRNDNMSKRNKLREREREKKRWNIGMIQKKKHSKHKWKKQINSKTVIQRHSGTNRDIQVN